ncbi:hypothetical protein ACFC18_21945 [Streptomyces sp. NPDC056121]|uniref:hypothetical protein n=1 Tax=unclassified Streptomyces TaxID=2593676 RepID=UPI0035DD5F33
MKRRRQCPAIPTGLIGADRWRCQRLVDHAGRHEASKSDRSAWHYAWSDGATSIFDYKMLHGTVRFPAPFWTPRRRYRAAEVAMSAVSAAALWWAFSLYAVCMFLLADLHTSIRRSHFVDVGRFTVGVYCNRRDNYPPGFAIGFARYGPEAGAPRSGLTVTIGRLTLIACVLLPRAEWADFQARPAYGGRAGCASARGCCGPSAFRRARTSAPAGSR